MFVAACASPLNESPAVIGAEIESETRRGGDYVRVTITAAVDAGADTNNRTASGVKALRTGALTPLAVPI